MPLTVLIEKVMHSPDFPGAPTGEFEHGDSDGSFEVGLEVCIWGEKQIFLINLPEELRVEEEGVLVFESDIPKVLALDFG